MTEKPLDVNTCQDMMRTAVDCYLSTILTTAECMAKVCPEVGVPYQNRWRRLPQRIGFDLSSSSLQASGQMFRSDLERFTELACRYFNEGLHLIHTIGTEGARTFELAVQEAGSHANLLEGLAESLEESADLDASPEIREMLLLQSEGLRKSARQVRSRLLPSLYSLTATVRDCRRAMLLAEQDAIVDASTGFVNSRGFRYELKARYDQSQRCCVLLIDCTAVLATGQECSDEDFGAIAGELAARVGDQFRPSDCLGRVGQRRLAVIFEHSPTTARDRADQIARDVSGVYSRGVSVRATVEVMEVSDADSLLTVLAAIDKIQSAAA